MPKTHESLKELKWVISKSKEPEYLIYTDVAKDVQEIIAIGKIFQTIYQQTHIKPSLLAIYCIYCF